MPLFFHVILMGLLEKDAGVFMPGSLVFYIGFCNDSMSTEEANWEPNVT